jgi:cell division transport system permease protein
MSITLVLFLMGLLALVYFYAHKLNEYYRENFEISIYFNDGVEEEEAIAYWMFLKQNKEVRNTNFVSKDQAAKQEIEAQGIDFIQSLGYNPLPHALYITLHAEYTQDKQVSKIVSEIKKSSLVESVVFPQDILKVVNQNLKSIEYILISVVLFFLVASLLVINNTIRLNIFARRFLIKSMQYVGATDWFILKPFLKLYLLQGIVGAILAIILNALLLHIIDYNFPNMLDFSDPMPYIYVSAGLLLMSFIIIFPATYFATKKYLKTDINRLY